MMEHFFDLYIGDIEDTEIVNWLSENLSPVVFTTRSEFAYYDMYHGDSDLWILQTTDVSDVSGQFDTITHVRFKSVNDLLLCKLTWGGSGP